MGDLKAASLGSLNPAGMMAPPRPHRWRTPSSTLPPLPLIYSSVSIPRKTPTQAAAFALKWLGGVVTVSGKAPMPLLTSSSREGMAVVHRPASDGHLLAGTADDNRACLKQRMVGLFSTYVYRTLALANCKHLLVYLRHLVQLRSLGLTSNIYCPCCSLLGAEIKLCDITASI